MIYQADFTTPANTAADSPLITTLPITKGLIYNFHIYCPHGAMGLHYIQIHDGTYQLWPSSPGAAIRGDGIDMGFDDMYLKRTEPFELQIKSWNLDTDYDHLAIIYVAMASQEAFMSRYMPGSTQSDLLAKLQEIYERQEIEKAAVIAEGFSLFSGA